MAREIWLKAEAHGLETLKDGSLRLLARCGHCETGPDLVHAPFDSVNRLHELECWAKGIVNSSNNVLVRTNNDGFAPLGKADGPARTEFGMQIREARNEFSRDNPIEFLPSKENAERMCRLRQKFCGHGEDLAVILAANSIKPDLLSLKQLIFLANMVEATLMKGFNTHIELDQSVQAAVKKIR